MANQEYSGNRSENDSPDKLPKEARDRNEDKLGTTSSAGLKPEGTPLVEESGGMKERAEETELAKNQIRELSPNFTFKLIMGGIFLAFTIYFLYLLIKILTG